VFAFRKKKPKKKKKQDSSCDDDYLIYVHVLSSRSDCSSFETKARLGSDANKLPASMINWRFNSGGNVAHDIAQTERNETSQQC
jgi:hypothetical protein